MILSKEDMIKILDLMQINTDNVILLRDKNHELNQALYHEKWKVRYLTRRLKVIDPNEYDTKMDKELIGLWVHHLGGNHVLRDGDVVLICKEVEEANIIEEINE